LAAATNVAVATGAAGTLVGEGDPPPQAASSAAAATAAEAVAVLRIKARRLSLVIDELLLLSRALLRLVGGTFKIVWTILNTVNGIQSECGGHSHGSISTMAG
jgi:hypothetical protein